MVERVERLPPPGVGKRPKTPFWDAVNENGDCWEWQMARNSSGYGSYMVETRTAMLAHRYAYEQMVGPIPEGLEIDHLCRNRGCVRPDHLEPVTHSENMRRARADKKGEAW